MDRSGAWAGLVLAATMAASAAAEPANLAKASPGSAYFNRPGASMADHDRELRECLVLAARTRQPGMNGPYGGSVLSAALIGGVMGLLDGVADSKGGRVNAENCMVVRGWRVVRLPDEEADALGKLDQLSLAAKLKDWVGAAQPHGELIRQWNNDAVDAATVKWGRASIFAKANLSFAARDRSGDAKTPQPGRGSAFTRLSGSAKELKPQDLGAPSPDMAVIVFEVKDSGLNADTVVFRRMGPDPDTRAHDSDKLPDTLWGYDNWVWQPKGKWFAYAVPPGRWRIDQITNITGDTDLSLCLGSPAFEAKAGEVLFAGVFDLKASYTGPDLDLAPARAWLGEASPVAGLIRPAAYVNGARGRCDGVYIYDYEARGAPYLDGYAWGGAARPAAAADAAGPAPPPPTPPAPSP